MQREKAKKNQVVVTISILILFLFSLIISGFPVYARSPVVVIQPGHSVGYDPGATNSSTGITEAAVNAAVAGKVATKLKQLGYTVYLTHPVTGCSVQSLLTNAEANSLSNVANAINKIKPDLAISVHHNSGGSSASGYEFYWSSYRDFDQEGVYEVSGLWAGDMAFRDSSPCWAAQESKVFASVLEKNFNGIGIDHRKTVERDDYVQAHVTCPSVLIEGGFISNPSESLLLASDAFQEKMSGRIVNSVSEYFGGATKDEKAPTADSITTPESPTTNAVFTVTANGVKDDLSGVSDVRVAIWSFENGQDDLRWYPAQNDGQGNWTAKIDIKDHNNEVGYYAAHFYATDNIGNEGFLGYTDIFLTSDESIPNGLSCKLLSSNQFKVYLKGYENYSKILFPVWSESNGQDDLIWYDGTRQTDGSYAVIVNNKDHGYDTGNYTIHVYGRDNNGKETMLGITSVNVPGMTAGNVTASEVANGEFTVTVKDINAPSGINKILVPVWSENNGQDDLVWYEAQRQYDGSYKVSIKLKDHGYDTGSYTIHVYGRDNNGKETMLGITSVNVPGMTAGNVTASEVANGEFTVTVKDINAPSGINKILVPVWSENNGQDDLVWYEAQRQYDGSYKVSIKLKDHGYDTGSYTIHVYGRDNNGKETMLGITSVNVPGMTAGNVTASEVANGEFTVTVKDINAPSGINKILVPVWSENNGQDDLVWYEAQRQYDGSYKVSIKLKDHGYDTGNYTIHVYGRDNNGKETMLGITSVNVPGMTAGNVTASEVANGEFTVTVKDINAPSGINKILVPVWSENNGQDDLVWYEAQRQYDGSYKVSIKIKDHGYDTGSYTIHVYGRDNNGKETMLGITSVNVPGMTAGNVTASEVANGEFTVTVKDINAPSGINKILVPVWSENNGQDDLVWYEAQRQYDGSYKVSIKLKDHGYDTGNYTIHVYGRDNNGKETMLGITSVNVAKSDVPEDPEIVFSTVTSIMGIQTKSAQELADYFSSKASFPSSFYGMSTVDFANIYIEECKIEGVRPEVAFAQMCLETGYLQYGGDVKREQFNFAGIGAIGNGAPGNSFADVRTGIRAQVQHLKAYASTEGLVNECVDPRYQYVNKGCAPTVGDLAGKWAADVNYGNKLVTVMNAF